MHAFFFQRCTPTPDQGYHMYVSQNRAQGSIPTTHQTHVSLQELTSLPEKEELAVSVNQKHMTRHT